MARADRQCALGKGVFVDVEMASVLPSARITWLRKTISAPPQFLQTGRPGHGFVARFGLREKPGEHRQRQGVSRGTWPGDGCRRTAPWKNGRLQPKDPQKCWRPARLRDHLWRCIRQLRSWAARFVASAQDRGDVLAFGLFLTPARTLE